MTTCCEVAPTVWTGCYEGGWGEFITKESFGHPAKFSYALIVKIVKHMLARGWLKPGDVVADPFGGIGTGGIICAANGLRWHGVELEPRFVELAKQNFQLNPWCRGGECEIIQGDSRNFASLIGQCEACVTSPPYAESLNSETHGIDFTKADPKWGSRETPGRAAASERNASGRLYGVTPGQLASLPVGDVSAILTSPPYAGSEGTPSGGRLQTLSGGTLSSAAQKLHGMTASYGVTPGQLGAMKEGNVDAVVTSPPFETSTADRPSDAIRKQHGNNMGRSVLGDDAYGQSDGQLGNTSGDTYWTAVAEIYRQCLLALKPGGYIAVVVKSFVKAGKIVDLPESTWKLLQHVGFEPVERVRAMLVKEDSHPGLFDGPVVKKTERKSFFRRLAERKGSPPIDYEEVLFLSKP